MKERERGSQPDETDIYIRMYVSVWEWEINKNKLRLVQDWVGSNLLCISWIKDFFIFISNFKYSRFQRKRTKAEHEGRQYKLKCNYLTAQIAATFYTKNVVISENIPTSEPTTVQSISQNLGASSELS